MSTHFIERCSCGAVIAECRCPDPYKQERIVQRGCAACRGGNPGEKPPDPKDAEIVSLRKRVELAEAVAFRVHAIFPIPIAFRENRNGTLRMEHEIERADVRGFLEALHAFSGDCLCSSCESDRAMPRPEAE